MISSRTLIRDYTEADLAALEAIHARQALDYPFPDLASPLFDTKLVAERDGVVTQALLLRITAEAYLLLDQLSGTPSERWGVFQTLHRAAAKRAWQRGFADVHAYVPREIERHFAKRLMKLGWKRDAWQSYFREITAADDREVV